MCKVGKINDRHTGVSITFEVDACANQCKL